MYSDNTCYAYFKSNTVPRKYEHERLSVLPEVWLCASESLAVCQQKSDCVSAGVWLCASRSLTVCQHAYMIYVFRIVMGNPFCPLKSDCVSAGVWLCASKSLAVCQHACMIYTSGIVMGNPCFVR